jgi:hypothetical protein
MSAADDWSQKSCRACGKKLDGISEFAEHVTTEHPIKDNNNSYYEDSRDREQTLSKPYLHYVNEHQFNW